MTNRLSSIVTKTGDNGTTSHYAYHSGNQPGAAYNGQQTGTADHTAQAQPTGQTYGTPTEPPEPGKPEKKKNKKTITIVVSVLVVGAACRHEYWPHLGSDLHVVVVGVEVGNGAVQSGAVRADQA